MAEVKFPRPRDHSGHQTKAPHERGLCLHTSALRGHGISLSRRGLRRCFWLGLGMLRRLLRLGKLPRLLSQFSSASLPCPIAVFVAHGSLLSIHRRGTPCVVRIICRSYARPRPGVNVVGSKKSQLCLIADIRQREFGVLGIALGKCEFSHCDLG